MKICTKCKQEKPESAFYLDKRRNHLCAECRQCTIARTNVYRKNNRPRINAAQKLRPRKPCKLSNEQRLNRNAWQRAWQKAHRAEQSASQQRWKDQNPEKVRAKNRRWRSNNLETARTHERNSRLKRNGVEGICTGDDVNLIFKAQMGKCAYCRIKLGPKFHRDHIIPLSKGGTNWPRNVQLTCVRCNLKKLNRNPIDFARSLGRLL